MVGRPVLHDEALVAHDSGEDGGLFDGPCANVCPLLIVFLGILLLGRGSLPSRLPVVGELFEEGCLETRWLRSKK